MSKKEMTTKQTTEIATRPAVWGIENVSKKDVIIPRIYFAQSNSTFVREGRAVFGDIVDMMSLEKLGSMKQPLKFVPFYMTRYWKVDRDPSKGTKKEFVENLPMTADNEDLPLEFMVNGVKHYRMRVISVFALLPHQLEAGTNKIPYVIDFRSTSYMAGRKLVSFFTRLADFNLPPAARTFELSVSQRENESGVFVVADVTQLPGATPESTQALAYEWYLKIKQGAAKAQEDAPEVETPTEKVVNPKMPDGNIPY